MSFDPATYTEAPAKEANVFSLESLRNWLRLQDPTKGYVFVSIDTCLLTTYFADHGIAKTPGAYGYGRRQLHKNDSMVRVAMLSSTLGTALARCEALLAKQ